MNSQLPTLKRYDEKDPWDLLLESYLGIGELRNWEVTGGEAA
jgi:hypothetical protein